MMLAATDYIGLGSLIAATCAGIVSIIVALRQNGTVQQVKDVHAAVSMSNGATLGQVIEKIDGRNEAIDKPPVP